MTDLPIMLFETEQAWEQWLEENHATSQGLWLKIAKKDSGETSVFYQEALTAALCFGWIDGQKGALDDSFWLQKFTPRRSKSRWSKINREKAIVLIEQGRMREAGLREIERAKQDGRWDAAYESQRNTTIPNDFQQALDANPEAKAFFEQLKSVNRYAILYQLQDAKRAETRQRRIEKFIAMLNEKKTLY
jgi:uncharacterized protein YdeI (YjbR/CyaY-like superfamily)